MTNKSAQIRRISLISGPKNQINQTMKVAESKTSALTQPKTTSRQAEQPFFQRQLEGGQSAFFGQQTDTPASFFQPKLKIGAPNDHYEKQADAVADKVVAKLNSPTDTSSKGQEASSKGQEAKGNVQRAIGNANTPPTPKGSVAVQTKGSDSEQEEKLQKKDEDISSLSSGELQRKPIFESNTDAEVQMKCATCGKEETVQRSSDTEVAANSDFESGLSSSKGGGASLSTDTRQKMESSIGADFSGVRIHTGSEAAHLSESIGAQAFTHGNDVYFNEGKYKPSSTEGSRLLAHELTHTVQQGAAGVQKKEKNTIQKVGDEGKVDIDNVEPNKEGYILKKKNNKRELYLSALVLKSHADNAFTNKVVAKQALKMPERGSRKHNPTNQAAVWKEGVKDNVEKSLLKKIIGSEINSKEEYKLTLKGQQIVPIAGNFRNLKNSLIVPPFDGNGKSDIFEIEHAVDWQILGSYEDIDNPGNLLLLDQKTNGDLGRSVMAQIDKGIKSVLKHYGDKGANVVKTLPEALAKYEIWFDFTKIKFEKANLM
jgi:Domain of unknown function (DUF4157)